MLLFFEHVLCPFDTSFSCRVWICLKLWNFGCCCWEKRNFYWCAL